MSPLLVAKKQPLLGISLGTKCYLTILSICQRFRLCEHAIKRVIVDAKELKTTEVANVDQDEKECWKLGAP